MTRSSSEPVSFRLAATVSGPLDGVRYVNHMRAIADRTLSRVAEPNLIDNDSSAAM